MPVIPVSGVYGDSSNYAGAAHFLQTREWRHTVGQSGMTPTAFAFLVPVFVMAVATPALCVFFVRKRRQTQVTPLPGAKPLKKPPLARDVAREKLKDVTEVSSLPGEKDEKDQAQVTTEEKDVTKIESRSIYEKECAICLSTLYAPSPPEPAKLIAESTTREIDLEAASTRTPSTTETPSTDPSSTTTLAQDTPSPPLESILKLQTCDHAFHSECLVSWFVLRKTSCPICRAAYFSKEDLQKIDDEQAALNPPPPPPPPPVSNWRYFLHGHRAMRGQPEPAVHPSHNSRIEIRPSRVG